MSGCLVLLRHGTSEWGGQNRFTGWADVPLSDRGIAESADAAHLIAATERLPDHVFSSCLSRASQTAGIVLAALQRTEVPVTVTAALMERHYGALTGRDRTDAIQEFGLEQVTTWRRSFTEAPPAVTSTADGTDLVGSESLKDVSERVVPFWNEHIWPLLDCGSTVLVVAHSNSLRALVKHVECIDDDDIERVEIPVATPRVYSTITAESCGHGVYLTDPRPSERS